MTRPDNSDRHKQQRAKNRAVMFLLLGIMALLYLLFLARAGGL
ncbi:MAG: hypothetical protein ACTSX7_09995 [Alphaproteobacteria bacterium]